MLGHIRQLGGVLRAHADVIATLEAGLIGLWGEGHGSINRLDQPGPRGRITAALLAELPASRAVLLRTPMMKAELGYPAALTDAQAFDGSAQARLGHHNDCFLADASDQGTYAAPVATWADYVAQDTRFVPEGGETCAVFPARTDCAPAVAELTRLHWSFLNRLYHPAVVQAWQRASPPCFDDIARRLGYRIAMVDASHSTAVRPGGVLAVSVRLRNEGRAMSRAMSVGDRRPGTRPCPHGHPRFSGRPRATHAVDADQRRSAWCWCSRAIRG